MLKGYYGKFRKPPITKQNEMKRKTESPFLKTTEKGCRGMNYPEITESRKKRGTKRESDQRAKE